MDICNPEQLKSPATDLNGSVADSPRHLEQQHFSFSSVSKLIVQGSDPYLFMCFKLPAQPLNTLRTAAHANRNQLHFISFSFS